MNRRMIFRSNGGITTNTSKICEAEPLEKEIARMKREKLPVKGGSTAVYGEEGEDQLPGTDFRIDRLDIAREELSTVMQQRVAQQTGATVQKEPEDNTGAGSTKEE